MNIVSNLNSNNTNISTYYLDISPFIKPFKSVSEINIQEIEKISNTSYYELMEAKFKSKCDYTLTVVQTIVNQLPFLHLFDGDSLKEVRDKSHTLFANLLNQAPVQSIGYYSINSFHQHRFYLLGVEDFSKNPAPIKNFADLYLKANTAEVELKERLNLLKQIGECFSEGKLTSQSDAMALYYWKRTSDLDLKVEMKNIHRQVGLSYLHGKGTRPSLSRAIVYLEREAVHGDVESEFELSRIFLNGPDEYRKSKTGIAYLHQAGHHGHVEACYELAMKYFYGRGVKCSIKTGKDWLSKSIQYKPQAKSCFFLACYYLNVPPFQNKKSPSSMEKAMPLLRQAAELNHRDAQYNLGVCLWEGKGCEKSAEEAIYWLREASNQNQPEAHYVLGDIHYKYSQNPEMMNEAIQLLNKAVDCDHARAAFDLGIHYLYKENDPNQAEVYFKKAAQFGYSQAQTLISQMEALKIRD